nr:hypothetical protein [Candidatus Freyarchaeota archaeon]
VHILLQKFNLQKYEKQTEIFHSPNHRFTAFLPKIGAYTVSGGVQIAKREILYAVVKDLRDSQILQNLKKHGRKK